MKRILDRWFCGDRWLLAIVCVAALLGLIYNAVLMVGFGPDEHRHMAYVQLLWEEHRLPFWRADGSPMGYEYRGAHSFHPPLYYLFLIPFYLVGQLFGSDATWHVVRLGSLILCLAALPLIYQIARVAGGREVARLATLSIAWLPMWNLTAATINNDGAVFFAVVLFLWLLAVRFADERSIRSALILGVVLGLGALCKATAILCDGVALLVYLWLQEGRTIWKSRSAWSRLMSVAGVTILIAGWWHVRSIMLYGQFTPLPPSMPVPALPNPQLGKLIVLMHPNFPGVFLFANHRLFDTVWAQRDWLLLGKTPDALRDNIRDAIYGVFAFFVVGMFFGLGRRGKNAGENGDVPNVPVLAEKIASRCALWAFAANWLTVLQVALFFHWGWSEGGRYLLPALCGVTICAARGWSARLGERLRILTVGFGAFLLIINMVSLYWLIAYLNPFYRPK